MKTLKTQEVKMNFKNEHQKILKESFDSVLYLINLDSIKDLTMTMDLDILMEVTKIRSDIDKLAKKICKRSEDFIKSTKLGDDE